MQMHYRLPKPFVRINREREYRQSFACLQADELMENDSLCYHTELAGQCFNVIVW